MGQIKEIAVEFEHSCDDNGNTDQQLRSKLFKRGNNPWHMNFGGVCAHQVNYCPYCGDKLPQTSL